MESATSTYPSRCQSILQSIEGLSQTVFLVFYDKLLADEFILKQVKHLSSLSKDVASTVDVALKSIADRGIKLPPPSGCSKLNKCNETSVAQFYARTTSTICAPVASMLALHPHIPTWLSTLEWTTSPSKSAYAIADGSLQIIHHDRSSLNNVSDKVEKAIWASMSDNIGPLLQEVCKKLPDLAVWEVKSLSVGDHSVMMGIRKEAFTGLPFRWERFDPSDHVKSRRYETLPMGPDAAKTPWKLESSTPLPSSESSDSTDAPGLSTVVTVAYGGEQSALLPSTSEATLTDVTENVRGRGRAPGRCLGAHDPVPKTRKERRGKKPKQNDDDENYKTVQELTAESYIQYAWAQGVRHDSTLIIFHSGNFEYVGVRHRESQTLYVSDLIDVARCINPGYGKLHVGIYITAIEDALDRVSKIPQMPVAQSSDIGDTEGNDRPRSDPKEGSRKGKERKHDGDAGLSKRRKTSGDEVSDNHWVSQRCGTNIDQCEDEQLNRTIKECGERNGLLMHFQYGIYNSPIPAAFIRTDPSKSFASAVPTLPPSPQHKRVLRLEERLMLVVTSEIAAGATGTVHGGTLEVEMSGQCLFLEVVVKLAFSHQQQESLTHENTVYRYLTSKRIKGIPTQLGLFNSFDDGPSALLMTRGGISIRSSKQLISPVARQEFPVTLQEIHNAGVLHGDIRRQNLLIDNSIIDFDRSKKTLSAKAMEEEFKQLVDLLENN